MLPFRNPIVTAKMVATLDQLSHGRVLLGIGVGNAYEYRALGLPWKGSGALTTEYLEAFRALWASETPVFHGNRIHLEGAMFKPRPVQNHIPIWVGGSSDGAFRRALRYGDGWHVARLSVDAIRPRVERLREIAADEGRDMSTFTLSFRPMVIFRDEPIPGDDPRLTGKAALPGYPVVGPPEYVAEQLARYQTELGFTHLSVDLYDWWTGMRFDTTSSLKSYLQAIETMATKVMPLLPR